MSFFVVKLRAQCSCLLVALIATLSSIPPGATAQNRVHTWGNNSRWQLGTTPPNWINNRNTIYGRNLPGLIRAFSNVVAIASGDNHTLALKSDGSVWAWGSNSAGQLGNGGYCDGSDRPTQVVGLSGVTAIAAGGNHSMALKSDGTVWTWGDNYYGQLGGGTWDNNVHPRPIQVTSLVNSVKQIAAGSNHDMVLESDGTVWLWGRNNSGQLGDGTTNERDAPVRVVQLSNITWIGASRDSSFAETKTTSWAWGIVNTSTPAQVPGLTGVTAFTGYTYYDPYVLKSDGTVWYITSSGGLKAVQVSGISNVQSLSGSGNFILAARTDKTVWGLGNNGDGELGNGTANSTTGSNWVPATGLTNVLQVQAGGAFSIALRSDNKLWSWGDNQYGQSALPSPLNQCRPTRPHLTLGSVAGAAVGSDGGNVHYLFLHSDGEIYSWGSSSHGQLGDGGTTDSYTDTVEVYNFAGAVQVAANQNASSYAIKSDGTPYGWGKNDQGQLGDGTTTERHVATRMVGLTGVKAIAPGTYHTLMLKNDGTVWACGNNRYGQIGDGTTTIRPTPVPVNGLSNIIAIAAGDQFSLALKSDGSVWRWGNDGTSGSGYNPTQVSSLTKIVAIAAGYRHSMALKSDGAVYCWGYNAGGQLGNGTTDDSGTPVQVPGLTNVVAITAGNDGVGQSFAIRTDNTVWAWGNDIYGQLGDGMMTPAGKSAWWLLPQPNPTQVFLSGVTQIISGGANTLALVKDTEPDFNGDHMPDLILHNSVTGEHRTWYMNGPTYSGTSAPLGNPISPYWLLGGTGDLNGDGQSDLIWQQDKTGNTAYWLMNGPNMANAGVISAGGSLAWRIVGTPDLNGDLHPDLLWQNLTTGAVTYWLMNGAELVSGHSILTSAPANMVLVGTADIDGDSNPDLIWQNTQTGDVIVWYMNRTTYTGNWDTLATGVASGWRLATLEDLIGDNQPDLIWQTATGDVVFWQINDIVGWTGVSSTIYQGVPANWSLDRAH